MSAVITNIDDLEFVWRAARDGFSAGIDFKTWLANTVISDRAELAAVTTERDKFADMFNRECLKVTELRAQLATYQRMAAVRQ